MKIVHSSSVLLMLAATALAGSCGSDDGTAVGTPDPIVLAPGGTVSGGAAAGGAASGTTAGSAGGALPGGTLGALAGGTTSGTVGGSPAGGNLSVTVQTEKPCEKKVRTAGKTIPDFMIVLDRSASMKPTFDVGLNCASTDLAALITCPILGIDCNSPQYMGTTVCGGTMAAGVDRWTPAVAALKSLTAMFETKVNFGLTIFPGPGQGANADCATGTQRVPVGLKTAGAIASALDMTQPGGRTPTGPTLQDVLQQIQAKKTDPDSQVPPQYVLLVTDGSPTCPGNQTANNVQADQATIQAIDALSKAGVKTYVIGYDASVDANLAKQLTAYAQHGGTNNFYAVQDGPSLVSQFTSITGVVAECSYALDMKPQDNKYVLVELDGKKLNLGEADGWTIDDKNVTIQGSACTTLRDGSKPHTLAVTVECVPQVLN